MSNELTERQNECGGVAQRCVELDLECSWTAPRIALEEQIEVSVPSKGLKRQGAFLKEYIEESS